MGKVQSQAPLCVDVSTFQLRREVRLRREYLYRKAQEDRLRTIEEKKQKLEGALDGRRLRFSIFLKC